MPALRAALQPSRRTAQSGARGKAASTAIRITYLIGLSVTLRALSIPVEPSRASAVHRRQPSCYPILAVMRLFLISRCTRRAHAGFYLIEIIELSLQSIIS